RLGGRAGRQGAPGMSKFYISFEDDLMRLFGSERMSGIVGALGIGDDEPIEHNMLSNAVESAQRRVEGKNFSIRKHVLQFDDVMNQQRGIIYAERQKVLDGEDLSGSYIKMAEDVIETIIKAYSQNSDFVDDWDIAGMDAHAKGLRLPGGLFAIEAAERDELTAKLFKQKVLDRVVRLYRLKEQELGPEMMREIERMVLLRVVDEKWMDHIDAMDELRHGINMRAYAQRDPIIEFKFEGFEMFEQMTQSISAEALGYMLSARLNKGQEVKRERVAEPLAASHEESAAMGGGGSGSGSGSGSGNVGGNSGNGDAVGAGNGGRAGGNSGSGGNGRGSGSRIVRGGGRNAQQATANQAPPPPVKRTKTAGRNDPCPCGSGKKYKNCHGNVA
ncbi:MAG: SEC-C metal-binding domain-containing protein, partial [Oscillospiraceae bacterium]|nr:SEC-C metal-binding domain-containing protein [Oscillospiraceae bacterium]